MKHLVWLILLSSILACGSAEDETIDHLYDPCMTVRLTASEDTSSVERASIEDAAQMWNQLGWPELVVADSSGLRVSFQKAPLSFLGVYEDEASEVFINRNITDARARAITIAHEVGHAMGLVHVDREDRASVMNPANTEIPPTARDRDELSVLWNACGS